MPVCLEITKIFDRCRVEQTAAFGPVTFTPPSGCNVAPYTVTDCATTNVTCTGTIIGGTGNFKTVQYAISGTTNVTITAANGCVFTETIPFTFTGSAILWAPIPSRMFVKCDVAAECMSATVVPTDSKINVTVTIVLCAIIKTAADQDFLFAEEPPFCPLPDVCTTTPPTPELCDFTIPQMPVTG